MEVLREDGDCFENGIKREDIEVDELNKFRACNILKTQDADGSVAGILPSKLEFDDVSLNESKKYKKKRKEIDKLLQQVPVSKEKLAEFAKSDGGLVDDELRAKAWPLLLGLVDFSSPPAPTKDELLAHPEYEQVVLDVNRSLKRFPPGIPLEQRLSLQNQLTRLILRVVLTHPRLRYYQGYHDVAVTLLLVTGENVSFFLLEHLSIHHLKDCMEPTMEKTSYLLNYIYPLIKVQNSKVYEWMEKAGVGTMFALPWFLTWFGHSLNSYKDVVRLYDYFLATEPLSPLYLSSVMVVHRADEILQTSCDMASLHGLLSHIPDDTPFDKLLKKTTDLYKKHPPKTIEGEVRSRVEAELRQRLLPLRPHRGAQHARGLSIWRWLGRIDPIRRLPLGFPLPHHIPQAVRRYRFLMAAFAIGASAYYMHSLDMK